MGGRPLGEREGGRGRRGGGYSAVARVMEKGYSLNNFVAFARNEAFLFCWYRHWGLRLGKVLEILRDMDVRVGGGRVWKGARYMGRRTFFIAGNIESSLNARGWNLANII